MKSAIEKKAKKKIAACDIQTLCEVYEGLNDVHTDESPVVRGWVMDELETRNPEKFNAWIETDDLDKMDSPSLFFI
jgi:hypothetical protein